MFWKKGEVFWSMRQFEKIKFCEQKWILSCYPPNWSTGTRWHESLSSFYKHASHLLLLCWHLLIWGSLGKSSSVNRSWSCLLSPEFTNWNQMAWIIVELLQTCKSFATFLADIWWDSFLPEKCGFILWFSFIGPESVHWECLSVTHWLTP